MEKILGHLPGRVAKAVSVYWSTRESQTRKQERYGWVYHLDDRDHFIYITFAENMVRTQCRGNNSQETIHYLFGRRDEA
jgi:hypothetical protein